MISNNLKVQNLINRDFSDEESSVFENFNQRLLGTKWNVKKDVISTNDFSLNKDANTKRSILRMRSIASEYDIFNINGPMLNRARLFMHSLQCTKNLAWDDVLEEEKIREWRNIVKQYNSSHPIELEKSFGGCMYRLKRYVWCSY